MSVASAATVITSPISTFASTRVRDGNFDPEAVGSRTLAVTRPEEPSLGPAAALAPPDLARPGGPSPAPPRPRALSAEPAGLGLPVVRLRSEEHTSELQSRPHLVCRLLLEKKKKKTIPTVLEKK